MSHEQMSYKMTSQSHIAHEHMCHNSHKLMSCEQMGQDSHMSHERMGHESHM
jgi:hypothetical protein